MQGDCASEVHCIEADGNGLLLVGGIVDSKSALRAQKFLNVLDQDVAALFALTDVSLQVKGILIEGDEFLVLKQGEGRTLDGGHVATNKQRR